MAGTVIEHVGAKELHCRSGFGELLCMKRVRSSSIGKMTGTVIEHVGAKSCTAGLSLASCCVLKESEVWGVLLF